MVNATPTEDFITNLSSAIAQGKTPSRVDFSQIPNGVDKLKVLDTLSSKLPPEYVSAMKDGIAKGGNPKIDFSKIQSPSQSSIPSYASSAQQTQMPISSTVAKGLGVGLETLNAPFQAVGEPIRQAITAAQGQNPGPYRAPTVLQRLIPSLQTKQQAPDMFSALVNPAVAGYKGIGATEANLLQGKGIGPSLQAGAQAVGQKPGLPEAALSTAAALGSGEAGNIPFTAAIKPFAALGKLLETGELAGIPAAGMIGKAASGADAVPLGLENLTAHANPEVLEAAQKANVPLTPAGITGSPTLSTIEGFLRKLPFSSNIMQKQFAAQLEALGKVRTPMVEATKPAADLGLDVQGALSNSSDYAYKNSQSDYANAGALIPQGEKIPVDNLAQQASTLLKAQAKLPPSAQEAGAIPLLKDLSGAGYERKDIGQIMPEGGTVTGPAEAAYEYPTLQALRASLNDKITKANNALQSQTPKAKYQSSPEAGIYGKLLDAIDQDLTAYSDKTGGAFKSAYSKATKNYQAYKQVFNDDQFVQSILNRQNPEDVVNKVVAAAKNNPRALGTLKLNLPTQTMNDLQTYFIKDMTEKDPNVFSPSHFVTQYNSIGEKKLTDILGPDKVAQLRPLYVLSKASINAEKLGQLATGPSGAGMAAGALGMTQPLMMAMRNIAQGHPIKGVALASGMLGAEMEGLPLLAKAYLSKPVGQVLTRQIGMTPSFPTAGQVLPAAGKSSQSIQDLITQLKSKYDQRRKF